MRIANITPQNRRNTNFILCYSVIIRVDSGAMKLMRKKYTFHQSAVSIIINSVLFVRIANFRYLHVDGLVS